ncbi:ATP-dependent helicase HrpB [Alteromonas gilva]|uniref:ATP-dependent helicase HrpB n=1 Tax=Alteromonas gilva TaxID=2987522 RepID=A0ABT5L5E2_9ALTE|nr:ATP-dependent helicase HrpB [Alteromonas gilva]MDC8832082.1 ATP-dependent helicase HrpB [Alteromonas gilva]
MASLPVESIIPALLTHLNNTDVLLSAPPGAGKSTAVPMALLAAGSGRPESKIVLLQPRRVVVKQLAHYLATQLGETVGQTVGFRIRGEQKVSPQTRLEIITEGILTRRLQQDPEIADVGIILFDEFHERSLHSDFSLALAIEVRQALRDDLRLVVMSATLDITPLQKILPDAAVLSSAGRRFPVSEVYLGACQTQALSATVATTITRVLAEEEGDILVFLPTVKHIHQVQQRLTPAGNELLICPLYGALPLSEQQKAIQPARDNKRKVILATNIAETSLTIEGIKLVIDSGREQVADYHPGTRMTELSLKMISQASAEQRKGRAGRVASGICYRLWGQEAHARLAEFSTPAIRSQDIAPIALHAAAWGTPIPALPLLEMPSGAQLSAAHEELSGLGLISPDQQITRLGSAAIQLPVEPKFASMLLRLQEEAALTDDTGVLLAGCLVAALAEESPKTEQWVVSDIIRTLPEPVRRAVSRQALRYASLLDIKTSADALFSVSPSAIALAIAMAQPAWLAKAKNDREFKLAMGTGAELGADERHNHAWLAVLNGQRRGTNLIIRLAEPIREALIRSHFSEQISHQEWLSYDPDTDSIRAEKRQYFQHVLLSSQPLSRLRGEQLVRCWQDWLQPQEIQDWPFFGEIEDILQRVAMARRLKLEASGYAAETTEWPDITSQWLLQSDAVHAGLAQCRTRAQLIRLNWPELILQSLTWPQRQTLEQQLPGKIKVPSGSQRPLRYESAERVVLSVKMQEMYGSSQPITVANGRQPVTVELLSPAGRPIQTTNDLPRFWQGSYTEVRKDMKGRYPKHYWPEDPTTALPSTKTTKNK